MNETCDVLFSPTLFPTGFLGGVFNEAYTWHVIGQGECYETILMWPINEGLGAMEWSIYHKVERWRDGRDRYQ
jgi:hypothetical protein